MKLPDYSIGGSPHQTHGLFPAYKLLEASRTANGKLTPRCYKLTSLLKLHECPDLNQTCPKDRDFPSGASYINIKIPAVKGTYGYKTVARNIAIQYYTVPETFHRNV
jgi:hypothetical protein